MTCLLSAAALFVLLVGSAAAEKETFRTVTSDAIPVTVEVK